jgi:hypothetical protein
LDIGISCEKIGDFVKAAETLSRARNIAGEHSNVIPENMRLLGPMKKTAEDRALFAAAHEKGYGMIFFAGR